MPPLEAFLSHSSHDREMADRLAQILRAHGVPTFYSPTNILGAQQWQDEILGALQRCDWFLVLLSPEAINSMWVKREVAYALSEPRYENRIVPLSYQPCELGSLAWLKLFQIIDFQGELDFGCRELLRVWGLGLKPSE
ncbi:MAG TPA: toll/interleukin-1 receptor domain-containing protein [Pirellulales bacterium]